MYAEIKRCLLARRPNDLLRSSDPSQQETAALTHALDPCSDSAALGWKRYPWVEMTMGMGFPMGMGITWDSHGNGNW